MGPDAPPSPAPAAPAPAHAVVAALEDLSLVDDEGRPVRLGDLWKDRPVVLAFLRHWG